MLVMVHLGGHKSRVWETENALSGPGRLWFMVYGLWFEGSGFRNALSGPSGWPRKTYRSLASLTAEQ